MAKILSARDDIASQVGGDVIRGLPFDGSGDPLFKSEDTLSAGYTDKTTLLNWGLYGAQVAGLDYRDFRNILMADFVGTWGSLTDDEKKLLVRNYVYDSAETIPNLDLLYTQAERDAFKRGVIKTLSEIVTDRWKGLDTDGNPWTDFVGPKYSTFGSPFTSPSVAANGGTQSFNITGFGAAGFWLQRLATLPSIDVNLYTVELFREDTHTTKQYELKDVNTSATAAVKETDELIGIMFDDDESGELHMKITNNDPDNAATFDVEAEGTDVAG